MSINRYKPILPLFYLIWNIVRRTIFHVLHCSIMYNDFHVPSSNIPYRFYSNKNKRKTSIHIRLSKKETRVWSLKKRKLIFLKSRPYILTYVFTYNYQCYYTI